MGNVWFLRLSVGAINGKLSSQWAGSSSRVGCCVILNTASSNRLPVIILINCKTLTFWLHAHLRSFLSNSNRMFYTKKRRWDVVWIASQGYLRIVGQLEARVLYRRLPDAPSLFTALTRSTKYRSLTPAQDFRISDRFNKRELPQVWLERVPEVRQRKRKEERSYNLALSLPILKGSVDRDWGLLWSWDFFSSTSHPDRT